MRYLFIGPDEKHFDGKKANKIKKLISCLFDYEYMMVSSKERTVDVLIKPSTGFTTAVAHGILDYRKNNPDKPIRVLLLTEFSTDLAELPEKTQELFNSLGNGAVMNMVNVDDGCKVGGKAAYSNVVSLGIPVYYYDPNVKVDKTFEKEYKYIEKSHHEKINLFDNFKGEAYSKDGVRKKATGLTYSYRLNTTLPNGKKLTEEWSNFVTTYHARSARAKRLVDAMWQDVEKNDITLTELFNEYIETKGATPALQTKYKQYHSALIVGKGQGDVPIWRFAQEDKDTLNLVSAHGSFHGFKLRYATDSRYKEDSYYDEDDDYHRHYLTDEYKQGFYAMLSNLFDYAYLKGYIRYQPLMLFDISKL